MTNEIEIKRQVREFYDQVGWQEVGEGLYQNARYEDLRPVSREYVHRCHLRVNRYLEPNGHLFLDAGSGPIQYPEYLTYSQGYHQRVCVDISIVALQEARERIGDHGLFVVADIANLPFKRGVFDGAVSLHTIHHLPLEEHLRADCELHRTLKPGTKGVIVNGWQASTFDRLSDPLIRVANRLFSWRRGRDGAQGSHGEGKNTRPPKRRKGTFVKKHNADWMKQEVGKQIPLEIRVWRSVNVRFMRAFVRERWGGRHLLRFVYWLEERFPRFLGEQGAYPVLVIHKRESG